MVEHIDFLPMFANLAQPAVRRLAEASAKEEGTLRYDIYQEPAPHCEPLFGRGCVGEPESL